MKKMLISAPIPIPIRLLVCCTGNEVFKRRLAHSDGYGIGLKQLCTTIIAIVLKCKAHLKMILNVCICVCTVCIHIVPGF